jgi:hypothetical protein
MKTQGSSAHSQVPAACPYPKPDASLQPVEYVMLRTGYLFRRGTYFNLVTFRFFELAFDRVDRDRMLNDLMILGIPKKLVQLISVTMAGSKATVRVDNQHTSTFPITIGARQGDALYSIIFDLVLEAILQKMNISGHIGTKSTHSCIC